ncbi:uncharacterized protein LOC114525179 [Dendronephthya gigantea]|uniref:uncharacterized protein LOC114525179 n=1 Tax=Dendronephthya gigantea TaxID=151771 RepID=UPI00106C6862|nr:uncharacterized protein LOC114525179 [Dendronephthya gigantea]
MSCEERIRYINTVKTASTHPVYKPLYDNLTGLHKTVFYGYGIHQKDFFLPWHRWYILQYENLLRKIDCRVTVPYWDWSLVAGDPWSSSIWNTGDDGFGGNGVPWQRCVNTGPFKATVWSLPASAGEGCLRRNFTGFVPDAITVKNVITILSNFNQFEYILRNAFHNGVHCSIGGTMCSNDSATAPEFFLHHGFVDKIWWDWQKSHTCKGYDFFHDQTGKMPFTPYRSRDFLDLKDQPDCVCVEYVDPKNDVYGRIKVMSQKIIPKTPRSKLPPVSDDAKSLFNVSEAEMGTLSQFEAKIQPKLVQERSSLRGKEAMLGFNSSYLY